MNIVYAFSSYALKVKNREASRLQPSQTELMMMPGEDAVINLLCKISPIIEKQAPLLQLDVIFQSHSKIYRIFQR
jgi:hypothetical protein